ncbi:phosphatidylinositol 3-kinase [Gymnopus androsaceus JB14]|uniref:phosphatidylinositol 3-kinase n=1 Tax=Gymnopus androsaceus JB14 TaxID=1447944 RepID=A0A6A4GUD0_9AGAR|nr:phosphatidylinositol 3-kinase [Gymnopus androsaceus JB14]
MLNAFSAAIHRNITGIPSRLNLAELSGQPVALRLCLVREREQRLKKAGRSILGILVIVEENWQSKMGGLSFTELLENPDLQFHDAQYGISLVHELPLLLEERLFASLTGNGTEANGSVESTTASKTPGSTDEMGRLEKLVKKYERGDLAKSEWLDKLTFRKMKEIQANPASTSALSPPALPPAPQTPIQSSANSFASDNAKDRGNIGAGVFSMVNLSDLKRKISYGSSASILLEINALTKLKAVTWRDPSEVEQVVEELLPQWTEIATDEALELLGPGNVDSRVLAFSVRQLMRADDEELLLYLLQLVQALKFESAATDQRSSRSATNAISYDDSGLTFRGECKTRYSVENGSDRRELLRRQGQLVETLAKRARELYISKNSSIRKKDRLQALLADSKNNLSSMPPLPLPLNPQIEITGIIPKKSSVFKSAMYPLLLTFQCSDGTECPVIFKDGHDMRQDQLVLQENLALKLTPYAVLATGPMQGMAQFMPSKMIAAIVSEHGNVLSYLRAEYPDEGSVGTWGIEPGVIDTFVRSCAGYCVVTYLLGVGDRHLDNLLVAPDGHFFHVDFGYIFGRDPKPFPPAVKVCKEMVDGMGGTQSAQYMRFKSFCFTAFTILRKSANLILNLIALIVDASITDIKHRDVHEQIQEKCRLDLTEEEAIKHFEIGYMILRNSTSPFHDFLYDWDELKWWR